jgi:hypothetical protein
MTQHTICDACETVAHCKKHGCIPAIPRDLSRMPGVDWWAVIVDLERRGYTHAATGAAIGMSRTAVEGWKNRGAEPGHEDGERLIALWRVATGQTAEHLPRKLEQILSAAAVR